MGARCFVYAPEVVRMVAVQRQEFRRVVEVAGDLYRMVGIGDIEDQHAVPVSGDVGFDVIVRGLHDNIVDGVGTCRITYGGRAEKFK
jgi:hypothetical protein